jgi:hypothetical protein
MVNVTVYVVSKTHVIVIPSIPFQDPLTWHVARHDFVPLNMPKFSESRGRVVEFKALNLIEDKS